ncbi:MAG: peptidylprolyl isomerase [Nanoarchaeota archaeon]
MSLQKKDFIEIDFTGRVKDGEVFDSSLKEDLEKLHHDHDHAIEPKPFVFCLGEGMFLQAIDDFLIGKEIGKNYEIELEPEKAFGKRNTALVQTIPLKIFKEKNVYPSVGTTFNFDGRIGKVLAVSGGRVMIDFNHFLAGKTLIYKITVLKKIDDSDKKIHALNEFFFRREFKYEVQGEKLIMEVEKPLVRIVELFKDKFKEILALDLEVKEIEEAKKEIEKSQQSL